MGMTKHFSSSSHDKKSFSTFSKWKNSPSSLDNSNTGNYETLPNPRPDNYLILRHKTVGKYLIIELKYLDCTNYEGRKILMFEFCTLLDLKKQEVIDPHFSDNKNFQSPIARFEPTERGWKMALEFAEMKKK